MPDSGQRKMEIRGISAALRQGLSGRPQMTAVLLQRFARLCVAALPDVLFRLPPAHPYSRAPSASCSLTCLIGSLKPLPVKVNWCLKFARIMFSPMTPLAV